MARRTLTTQMLSIIPYCRAALVCASGSVAVIMFTTPHTIHAKGDSEKGRKALFGGEKRDKMTPLLLGQQFRPTAAGERGAAALGRAAVGGAGMRFAAIQARAPAVPPTTTAATAASVKTAARRFSEAWRRAKAAFVVIGRHLRLEAAHGGPPIDSGHG